MSALEIEVTSETTALVRGAHAQTDVELSADDDHALFQSIEEFAKTEAAQIGEDVEISVIGYGATKQLTVTPQGDVALSGAPTGPIAPVSVPTTDYRAPEPIARPAQAAPSARGASSLVAPAITPGTSEPARLGWRGRANSLLRLGLPPKVGSPEMRQRSATAAITGSIPDFSIITVANLKGGVGKTPIAVGLSAVLAEHRGAGSVVCVDMSEERGSLGNRVSVPPRPGQDIMALLDAADTAPAGVRPSTLSRFLARQPGGDDTLAGNPSDMRLGFDDAATVADIVAQYREILIADTANGRLAGSWRWAVTSAHTILVPVPLRHDAATAADETLDAIVSSAGPGVLGRVIVVITDGPGDAPAVETDVVQTFTDQGVRVARMPYEPAFATGGRIAPSQLAPKTVQALNVLAALVMESIGSAID
jgi:MinD-like ATPase involved in chromosome partitioning or flagellar assembly